MKVLIIGKNGQLGQHLIKFFLEQHPSFEIVATQRHKSYDKQTLIFDDSKVKSELLDLTDAESINSVIRKHKPDYIFNTGANAYVGESWEVPFQHFEINTLGVLRILESIKNYSKHSRFLNLGTSEEFACIIENGKVFQDENTKISPRSPYGASKASARYLIDIYRESYNLYAIQPWTFNFESKIRGDKYFTRKISLGVSRIAVALENEVWDFNPIEVGNLNSFRSWQHASDVAEGLWLIINQSNNQKEWKPYVLSSHETYSLREFVEKSFEEVGIKGKWIGENLNERFVLVEGPLGTKKEVSLVTINEKYFRPLDVTFLWGNSTKAREELGWEPKVDFSSLIKEMVTNDYYEYKYL